MSLILSGTDGLSDVDGSAATPAIRGTDANTGIFFPAADTIAFAEGGAEVARFDSSGNLGLGTATPGTKLDVRGTINASDGTNGNIRAYVDGTSAYLQSLNQAANAYRPLLLMGSTVSLANNGVTNATLDSSGNLGLGVTPSATASGVNSLEMRGVGSGLVSFGSVDTVVTAGAFYSATGWKYAVSSSAVSYYYQSAGKHQWFNAPSGTAGNLFTATQAMTLFASGGLALGTTADPTNGHLAVGPDSGKTGSSIFWTANTGGRLYVGKESSAGGTIIAGTSAYAAVIGTNNAYPLQFGTNNAVRATIASGGQFCVNTTNTNGDFNVSGNVYLFSQSAGAGTHFLKWNSGTGQVTYDSSSRLVKDNIVDSPYGLAEVMQLKSRKYLRIDDQRDEIGLIADEVQAVMPEFVPMSQKSIFTKNKEDTELVPSGVYYEKLSSVLIKAIQEQQAIITTLTARITALEGASA